MYPLIPLGLTALVVYMVYRKKDEIRIGDEVVAMRSAFSQAFLDLNAITVGIRADAVDPSAVTGPIVAIYGPNGERLQLPAMAGPFRIERSKILRRVPKAA